MKNDDIREPLGVGLDIGTGNLVSARKSDAKTVTITVRDAFLDLEASAKRSLRMSNIDYIKKEGSDDIIVIGEGALVMANLFKREVRRPLSRGVISAGELDAQWIVSQLIKRVIGVPRASREICFYSVPAEPVDNPGQDIVYHTEVFRKILDEHGYLGQPMNEAMAIIYSQCAQDQFSGLSASFGSGMVNVALAYQANSGMEFSLSKSGDWIDQQSARAIGKTASQMCAIKERGVDLKNPVGREQQALAMYYRNVLEYCFKAITNEFKRVASNVELPEPVPFIVSGGTTKAGSFMEIFEEEFERVRKKFPIQISEVRHATNPLTAVAEGLLVLAQEEHANR